MPVDTFYLRIIEAFLNGEPVINLANRQNRWPNMEGAAKNVMAASRFVRLGVEIEYHTARRKGSTSRVVNSGAFMSHLGGECVGQCGRR